MSMQMAAGDLLRDGDLRREGAEGRPDSSKGFGVSMPRIISCMITFFFRVRTTSCASHMADTRDVGRDGEVQRLDWAESSAVLALRKAPMSSPLLTCHYLLCSREGRCLRHKWMPADHVLRVVAPPDHRLTDHSLAIKTAKIAENPTNLRANGEAATRSLFVCRYVASRFARSAERGGGCVE
jgi:hypothetical protein